MITVTFNFDSVEAAVEFLTSQGVQPPQAAGTTPEPTRVDAEGNVVTKKPRQPRSDAGKPRGAYTKKVETAAEAPAEAAAESPKPQAEQPTAAATAPAPKEPTLDDVKAAMAVLNKAKGIDANIQQLAKFGVQKASSLPKAKYAEFIATVLKAAS